MSETQYCSVVHRPIESVPVPNYTDEEHGTWELLYNAQEKLVHGRACGEFIEGLHHVAFPKDRIPALRDVSKNIEQCTEWKLLRVDGLVHPRDFFKLLASKIFPSTDFIRKRSELKYTPAPDMFHDLFGHAPLLTNPDFAEFFEDFGKIGVEAMKKYPDESHPVHQMLPRLYWFTVEFGLIQTAKGLRAYGAGSCSSPEELQFCVGDKCRHHKFDVNVVAAREYDIWHLQEDVFVIDSFASLGNSFRTWAKSHDIWH